MTWTADSTAASDVAEASAEELREKPRFRTLFRDDYDRVRRWARNQGVAADEADDVAQEVFVIAHRRLDDGFDRSWLFGTTRRVCATRRRGDSRRKAREEGVAWAPAPASEPRQTTSVERMQRAERFTGFLASLPESMRGTFELHVLDGLKPKEIAQHFEVPVDTIYSRIRRAKAIFGRWLAEEYEHG